jgi:hypothetical protein
VSLPIALRFARCRAISLLGHCQLGCSVLTCLGAVVLTLKATLSALGLEMTSTFLTSWVRGPVEARERGDEQRLEDSLSTLELNKRQQQHLRAKAS